MIDRKSLVSRHNPVFDANYPESPLSVGNGEFAFTADATGLQTFLPEGDDRIPLCTMAQWGWHSWGLNGGASHCTRSLRLKEYDAGGRNVAYMTDETGQEELFRSLRTSPHRLNLARIGFVLSGESDVYAAPAPEKLSGVRQTLILWEGLLSSVFKLEGIEVRVETAVHPDRDSVSFRIESSLLSSGRLAVLISFPYGSPDNDASDWKSPDRHVTEMELLESSRRALITRTLDSDSYRAELLVGVPADIRRYGPHEILVCSRTGELELSAFFFPSGGTPSSLSVPSWRETRDACRSRWEQFWSSGGAIELAKSVDSRAVELERRIVLSRYLTAIQCAGSLPPQETGLTCNSWYGKFHLEMHYWHSAHFALWDNPDLLLKSMGWYAGILPSARERAKSQGYRGARWPKMTDPSGRDSPSAIGPLLCWQQVHPIMYAELLRRANCDRAILDSFDEIIFETAEFMADYPIYDASTGKYALGPPLIPAQERYSPGETRNPVFELEYWRWGLATAIEWMERSRHGFASDDTVKKWKAILQGLSLPATGLYKDTRVYLSHELCPNTFTDFKTDHPSMLLAYGMLNSSFIDRAIMSSTYDAVLDAWDFTSCWGWDFPALAMTAARLGRTEDAVNALLMDTPKNTWRKNGHNAQLARATGSGDSGPLWSARLPLYLPGNGALLLAAGMMAAGWDGTGNRHAPGFPDDGSWTVSFENILPMP